MTRTRSGRRALNRCAAAPLPPGALDALICAHLGAYPASEFTAYEIGRVLGRSQGSVLRACNRLVDRGLAVQASRRPQRFRAAEASLDRYRQRVSRAKRTDHRANKAPVR